MSVRSIIESVRSIIERSLRSSRIWFVGLICGVLILIVCVEAARRLQRTTDWMTLPSDTVAESSSTNDELALKLIFPTKLKRAKVFRGYFSASPQIVALPGKAPFLLATPSEGIIAALDLVSGQVIWQLQLPSDPGYIPLLQATPVQVGERLVVAYRWISSKTGMDSNHARVIDLKNGKLDAAFDDLEFSAEVAASSGGGTVRFDPAIQHAVSALALISSAGRELVYVSFSSLGDQGGWHGWLFELDLGAWKRGPSRSAITSVFVTTPEVDCDGTSGKLCGGGLWGYSGPQTRRSDEGFEIIVQSGNGLLNLRTGDYAQSMLRLKPGLKFDPLCSAEQCTNIDPRNPPDACLRTCKNLFVPRLLPSDKPLRPADGLCDGKTFLQCLDVEDWDFGSSSPVFIDLPGKQSIYVTAGKAGDIYVLDATTLGIMYDRKQAVELCGTAEEVCPDTSEGMIISQPQVAWVEGRPVVVIATHNPDHVHAAGVIGYAIVTAVGEPHLKKIWQVPPSSAPEAKRWFRALPTRPIIADFEGEPIAWVADSGLEPRLLGIRIRDGKLVVNVRTAGSPQRNAKPVIYRNVLYLPTVVPSCGDLTWIEAYQISRRPR